VTPEALRRLMVTHTANFFRYERRMKRIHSNWRRGHAMRYVPRWP
jgi:hypothetical protein